MMNTIYESNDMREILDRLLGRLKRHSYVRVKQVYASGKAQADVVHRVPLDNRWTAIHLVQHFDADFGCASKEEAYPTTVRALVVLDKIDRPFAVIRVADFTWSRAGEEEGCNLYFVPQSWELELLPQGGVQWDAVVARECAAAASHLSWWLANRKEEWRSMIEALKERKQEQAACLLDEEEKDEEYFNSYYYGY